MAFVQDPTPWDEHQPQRRRRTIDVTTGAAGFEELMLPRWLLDGLAAAGFVRPSPVQTAAIPLGRLGADLIVQAKAGTGKTLVFGTICLEKLQPEIALPQILILAPTHEIALQSAEVLSQLAAHMPAPGAAIGVFIGGLPVSEDQKLLRRRCNIAVGTPGRVCRLLEIGALVPRHIRTLVLDEADHLMSDSFIRDIRYIAQDVLPARKQVLALSATYPPALLAELDRLTEEPHHVMLCPETVSLLGVQQFFDELPEGLEGAALQAAKVQRLLRVLSSTTFHQALVFCNSQPDAQALADQLCGLGYPAAFVSGSHAQVDRMDAVAAVHDFKVRVVVATDLASRGLDLANVNLVANLDLPYDAPTYMHRVGRTGRFGTHGTAIAFVTPAELRQLRGFLQDVAGGQIEPLPAAIPEELHASLVSLHKAPAEAALQSGSRDVLDPGAGTAPSTPPGRHHMQTEAAQSSGVTQHHRTAGTSGPSSTFSPAAAAETRQVLWTHSEGSLSSEPDMGFDDEGCAAEDLMQQEGADESDSDAEAYSEVSARFGGDAVDTSDPTIPDACHSHPLAEAGRLPYSGTAAAVLETSLWAEPASSPSGNAPRSMAMPQPDATSQADTAWAEDGAQQSAAQPADGASGVTRPQPLPPPEQHISSEADGILVPPDLLIRYYQLEAFAAEYYSWFCRTQQQAQGQ